MPNQYMLTKLDMARVIVQAMCMKKELPEINDFRVVRMAKKKKEHLAEFHQLALSVIRDLDSKGQLK